MGTMFLAGYIMKHNNDHYQIISDCGASVCWSEDSIKIGLNMVDPVTLMLGLREGAEHLMT